MDLDPDFSALKLFTLKEPLQPCPVLEVLPFTVQPICSGFASKWDHAEIPDQLLSLCWRQAGVVTFSDSSGISSRAQSVTCFVICSGWVLLVKNRV